MRPTWFWPALSIDLGANLLLACAHISGVMERQTFHGAIGAWTAAFVLVVLVSPSLLPRDKGDWSPKAEPEPRAPGGEETPSLAATLATRRFLEDGVVGETSPTVSDSTEAWGVHRCLDERGVPRERGGRTLNLWGRVVAFVEAESSGGDAVADRSVPCDTRGT